MQQADEVLSGPVPGGSSHKCADGIGGMTVTLIDPFEALYQAQCGNDVVADLIEMALERLDDVRSEDALSAAPIKDRNLRLLDSVLRAAQTVQQVVAQAVTDSDNRLHALHVPAQLRGMAA